MGIVTPEVLKYSQSIRVSIRDFQGRLAGKPPLPMALRGRARAMSITAPATARSEKPTVLLV